MNDSNLVIGILGGMGTYATINTFRQYAEIFPAEKEWDRPRIIIDNNCIMPSRVRAILYGEQHDALVSQMMSSLSNLVDAGCTKIILACNTSHFFLNEIIEREPELDRYIVNIVDACVSEIIRDGVDRVYLLASEGTIKAGIYMDKLNKAGVKCVMPEEKDFAKLRKCIEAVKQNRYTVEVKSIFEELMSRDNNIILGCTELPVLYDRYMNDFNGKAYDPCRIALKKIKKEYYI